VTLKGEVGHFSACRIQTWVCPCAGTMKPGAFPRLAAPPPSNHATSAELIFHLQVRPEMPVKQDSIFFGCLSQ
jgi:hypothetical protein